MSDVSSHTADKAAAATAWPAFDDIAEPVMVCFGVGNGSGSKLFQAHLDAHPEIYMTPGYQLMYLYPHWHQWREEMGDDWSWPAIVDAFCEKHASLLDSRNIPGNDGLDTLGDDHDQHLFVDEGAFRSCLLYLLADKPLSSRTFILAVHYAYAIVRGEDIEKKRVLVYHLHVHEYVHYLKEDFPDMRVIAFVRDPRANLKGRFNSNVKIDKEKLNGSDAAIYLRRTFLNHWQFHVDSFERLRGIPNERMRVVRHEDINLRRDELMQATAAFLGIAYHPCLNEITFGGLKWWGASHYEMKPMNKPNPRTISDVWKKELPALDWFVLEGLGYDYCRKYGYQLFKFRTNSLANRILLLLALFMPMRWERWIAGQYFSPAYFRQFLNAAKAEANGGVELKDYRHNAFYRHKWCNQGLDLHVTPWYRRGAETGTPSAGRTGYVTGSVLRYIGAVLTLPLYVARRIAISLRQYIHVIRGTDVLPDAL
ncbi:MAG: sulfotransferase [Rhodospirillales bacterium]|nr:sulfotransferase [Rhodospirillales bacterium]